MELELAGQVWRKEGSGSQRAGQSGLWTGPRHRRLADIRDPGPGRHHHWSLHSPRPATLAHTADTATLGPQTVIWPKMILVFALRAHFKASDHWPQVLVSLVSPVLVMWRAGQGWLVIPPGPAVLSLSPVSLCLQAGQGQACLLLLASAAGVAQAVCGSRGVG